MLLLTLLPTSWHIGPRAPALLLVLGWCLLLLLALPLLIARDFLFKCSAPTPCSAATATQQRPLLLPLLLLLLYLTVKLTRDMRTPRRKSLI